MEVTFDIINISIAMVMVANLISLLLVQRSGNVVKNHFALLVLSIISWGAAMILFRGLTNMGYLFYSALFLYASAATIPVAFLFFVFKYVGIVFPKDMQIYRRILITTGAVIVFGSLIPNALIIGVAKSSGENLIYFNHTIHLIYALYISIFFTASFLFLLHYLYSTRKSKTKTQTIYILFATAIPVFISSISNLILPLNGVFTFNWVGQIATGALASIIAYGILRNGLFKVRVFTTEIIVFFAWIASFIQIIIGDERYLIKLFDTAMFAIFVVVGVLLVKNVSREMEAKEQLEKLSKDLRKTNKKLKKLDSQKTEFLSIATHQLRGPITAINGYSSLILEGAYGDVPDKIKKVIENTFKSGRLMAETINDFLNVSRIEQGGLEYHKHNFLFCELVEDVVNDYQSLAKRKDIKLELNIEKEDKKYNINGDYGKIKHIVSNIVDNAIKYTPKGGVHVELKKGMKKNTVQCRVKDSGIGIPRDEIDLLFDKFVRSRNAYDVNVTGSGLGLYVARSIVEAHNGKIWAESDGEGRGSTFVVELPLVKK